MTVPHQNTPGEALSLPRPPGVFRRWLAAHPRTVDGVIVGCYLFGCALAVSFDLIADSVVDSLADVDADAAQTVAARGVYLSVPWVFISVLMIAAVATALAYRRRFPLAGVIVVSLLQFFEQGLLVGPNAVALVFLLFAVPVYRGTRAGWIAFGVALFTSVVQTQLTVGTGSGLIGPAGIVLGEGPIAVGERIVLDTANALWLLVVLMVGINLGNRRRYVEALIDRAHQLAREREQRAELAVAAERARIAREMHDIVAHSLTVMVALSEGALASVDADRASARQAMERTSETGRSALVEMRRLLGVLRTDEAAAAAIEVDADIDRLSPQPGVAEIPQLITGFTDSGLRIELTEQGSAPGDAVQQLAMFRIVQEALTNALRYAGPRSRVVVLLEHEPHGTEVIVVDDGGEGGSDRATIPLAGAGSGLAGLRARMSMLGGQIEAGPEGNGWRVHATIPSAARTDTERQNDE